jgi:hypothetical protein
MMEGGTVVCCREVLCRVRNGRVRHVVGGSCFFGWLSSLFLFLSFVSGKLFILGFS